MSLRKRISPKSSVSVEEEIKRFIIAKKAKGLADKTLATYQQHFHAIGKHDRFSPLAQMQRNNSKRISMKRKPVRTS